MLKDFVKAAKEQVRFFKVPIEEVAEMACELVGARGRQFIRGVVFKEWVKLAYVRGEQLQGDRVQPYVTNEWRLWFGRGKLLASVPNSFQDSSADAPLEASTAAAAEAARHLSSPFLTIDLAECEDGSWICLEANDGGAAGPGPFEDLVEFWQRLERSFFSAG